MQAQALKTFASLDTDKDKANPKVENTGDDLSSEKLRGKNSYLHDWQH